MATTTKEDRTQEQGEEPEQPCADDRSQAPYRWEAGWQAWGLDVRESEDQVIVRDEAPSLSQRTRRADAAPVAKPIARVIIRARYRVAFLLPHA